MGENAAWQPEKPFFSYWKGWAAGSSLLSLRRDYLPYSCAMHFLFALFFLGQLELETVGQGLPAGFYDIF